MNKTVKMIVSKFLAVALLPLAVYAVFAALRPQALLSVDIPFMILNQCLNSIVLAWGMSFAMMIGNMDFSAIAERILGSITGIMLCNWMGPAGLVLGVLLVAVIVGFAKAVLAAAMDVKSRVITIAYTLVLGSFGYIVTAGDTATVKAGLGVLGEEWFCNTLFVVLGVIMYVLHRYSLFGAQCRALAGNEALALSAGIKKKYVEGVATVVCSLFIAASALLAVARGGGATPQSGLTSMSAVFSAMSAVFIANALSRYISQPIGIIVGSYTMTLMIYGLVACNLPTQLTTTVNGGFLFVILIFTQIKDARDQEKIRRAAVAANMAA